MLNQSYLVYNFGISNYTIMVTYMKIVGNICRCMEHEMERRTFEEWNVVVQTNIDPLLLSDHEKCNVYS